MEDAIWLARCLGSTTLGAEDAVRRYESKRRERAELIVSSSRKKAESLHAMEPEVYTAYYAAVAASSVTATMRAQEELLEEGPFG
jgi:FAD-dependent urate hydroxylase